MKTTKLLLLALFAYFSVTSVYGKDVYVYGAEGNQPLYSLTGVQKIVFGSEGMTTIASDGSETVIQFSEFNFFSFEPKTGGGAASLSLLPDNDLFVYFEGDHLFVKSEMMISNVELYSIQGTKLNEFTPMSREFNFSMSSFPKGIYLIKVVSGEKGKITKILKN